MATVCLNLEDSIPSFMKGELRMFET